MSHRHSFEVPDGAYLLSHSVGCLPRSARDNAALFMQQWAESGGAAWPAWMGHIERFQQGLARLFNAQPEEFCPQLNVSSALTKLIGSLPRRSGRTRLLLSELDFPTIGFVVQSMAQALGYTVEFIPAGNGTLPAGRWIEHLGPDVQLAHVTCGFSENSYCPDIAEIMAAAHQRGVFVVVDVAQSAGVLPIDFAAWDAVAVTGSCVKWLCGGPGAGWLWVRSDLAAELHPTDVGWWSHADPFEFDIRHFEFAPDARRFMGGTASPLPYAIATAGIEALLGIGVDNVRAHNLALTARLIETAQELNLVVNSPLDHRERGGTVVLDFPDRAAALAQLAAAGIHADARPRYGLRFSPHIYNTAEEIEYVIETLRGMARTFSAPAGS